MNKNKSAKDIAFDRERLDFHKKLKEKDNQIRYWELECAKEAAIRKYDDEIIELLEKQMIQICKKIGVPKEVLLADIERTEKASAALETMSFLAKTTLY